MIKNIILLSVFILAIQCQNAQTTTKCTEQDRLAEECIQIQQPVCGYFSEKEYDNFSNKCVACKNKNVQYIIEGECGIQTIYDNDTQKDEQEESTNDNTTTNDNTENNENTENKEQEETQQEQTTTEKCLEQDRNVDQCAEVNAPVCGYVNQQESTVFPNRCTACKNKLVQYVKSGQCVRIDTNDQDEETQENQDNQENQENTENQDAEENKENQETEENGEKNDEDDIITLPGQISRCLEEERKVELCAENHVPVCGYAAEKEFDDFTNRCYACKNKNVSYTVPGECKNVNIDDKEEETVEEQQENTRDANDCEGIREKNIKCEKYYEPVCGNIGEGKFVDSENECQICNLDIEVSEFYYGICFEILKEDEVIIDLEDIEKPENNGGDYLQICPKNSENENDICTTLHEPVCAFYLEIIDELEEQREQLKDIQVSKKTDFDFLDSELNDLIDREIEERDEENSNNKDDDIIIIDDGKEEEKEEQTQEDKKKDTQDTKSKTVKTYSNSCQACSDQKVQFFIKGSCSQIMDSLYLKLEHLNNYYQVGNVNFCEKKNRPEICTEQCYANRIIGVYYPQENSKESPEFVEFCNECLACADENVQFFFRGPFSETKLENYLQENYDFEELLDGENGDGEAFSGLLNFSLLSITFLMIISLF